MRFHDLATDKILLGTMGIVLALLIVRPDVDAAGVRALLQLVAFSLLVVYGWRARGLIQAQDVAKAIDD
jgi:hypothetical protein